MLIGKKRKAPDSSSSSSSSAAAKPAAKAKSAPAAKSESSCSAHRTRSLRFCQSVHRVNTAAPAIARTRSIASTKHILGEMRSASAERSDFMFAYSSLLDDSQLFQFVIVPHSLMILICAAETLITLIRAAQLQWMTMTMTRQAMTATAAAAAAKRLAGQVLGANRVWRARKLSATKRQRCQTMTTTMVRG